MLIPRRLREYSDRKFISEIEMEFSHHIDAVIEANEARGMDLETARSEALQRFGPVDDVVRTCLLIRRRGSPFQRSFRWFLCLVFLTGMLARFAGADAYELQIGNMLMTIAVACGGLLFIRRASRTSSVPVDMENRHPLGLTN